MGEDGERQQEAAPTGELLTSGEDLALVGEARAPVGPEHPRTVAGVARGALAQAGRGVARAREALWPQAGTGQPGPGSLESWLARPVAGPASALAAMMLVYVVVFGTLTYRQQSNYGTFGFDMGIYDQAIWLMAHFRGPFVTIRGLNYFGNNVDPITALFVPFYWLGAGPHFLYISQTLFMAAGAVPIWLLGRRRFASAWPPLAISAAYLLYPSTEWINYWQFRPDTMMIAPLMWAYYFASRGRWRWFWAATVFTLLCKEDAGLAVFGLGFVVWLKHRSTRQGLLTATAGVGWFLACTHLIIPWVNGGGQPFYVSLFPGYGNSMLEILKNLVLHPSRWLHAAFTRVNMTYYTQLFWPVGLLALFSPLVMLIGLPQLFVNVISAEGYTNNAQYYYTSVVLAAIFLATVESCARWGRTPAGQRALAGFVFATALASNVAWSPSPISVKFHMGEWAPATPRDAAINKAIALVPPTAAVSATYDIDDHMSHRVLIYEFPNPWIAANWGLSNTYHLPDPSKVDWMVLDTTVLGNKVPLYQKLVSTEFRIVYSQDEIVVARRVKPGRPNDHSWPQGP